MTTETARIQSGIVHASGRFSTFYVADLFFGIDVLRVQEVLRYQPMNARA